MEGEITFETIFTKQQQTQTHGSKHIEATLVSIVFSVRCKFGFPTRVLHIERKEGILDLKINFTGQ